MPGYNVEHVTPNYAYTPTCVQKQYYDNSNSFYMYMYNVQVHICDFHKTKVVSKQISVY